MDRETEYHRLIGENYTDEEARAELRRRRLIPGPDASIQELLDAGYSERDAYAQMGFVNPLAIETNALFSPLPVFEEAKFDKTGRSFGALASDIRGMKLLMDLGASSSGQVAIGAPVGARRLQYDLVNDVVPSVRAKYGILHREVESIRKPDRLDFITNEHDTHYLLGVPNRHDSREVDHVIAMLTHPDTVEFYDPLGLSIFDYPVDVQTHVFQMASNQGKSIVYVNDAIQGQLPVCQAYATLRMLHPEMNGLQFNNAMREGATASGMSPDNFAVYKLHQFAKSSLKDETHAIPHFKHGGLIKPGRKYHH